MRFIKELLLAAVITVIFFTVLMAMLPSSVEVQRQIEINRPIVQVYDMIGSFKQFPQWSPWNRRDPHTNYTFTPNLTGPGAQVNWYSANDPRVGDGYLQIVDQSRNEWIDYVLNAPWRGNKTADLVVAENEAGAVVTTFSVHVDYGWDLFGRVSGRYLDGHLGNDLTLTLGQLKNRIEALPDVDYSEAFEDTPPIEVMMEPINVLMIPGQAATSEPYNIQPTLMNFTRILTATIDIKGLEQTGPRLAVLRRWAQNYDFDAAVPVAETEADDLPENVVFGTVGGGEFLKVNYRGARWDLPRQRDMLIAWAGANGYRIRGQIIEEFLNEPGGEGDDAIRDADLETNMYLPIGEPDPAAEPEAGIDVPAGHGDVVDTAADDDGSDDDNGSGEDDNGTDEGNGE